MATLTTTTDAYTHDAEVWSELTAEDELYDELLAELKGQLRGEELSGYSYE
jgi:hypothetical protein